MTSTELATILTAEFNLSGTDFSDFADLAASWYTMYSETITSSRELYLNMKLSTIDYVCSKLRSNAIRIVIGQDEVDRRDALKNFVALRKEVRESLVALQNDPTIAIVLPRGVDWGVVG